MIFAQVALGESGRVRVIPCQALTLAFGPGNAWREAVWVFHGPPEVELAAPAVREMIWEDGAMPIAIKDGNGRRLVSLPSAQGVTTLEPFGALCFVYSTNAAGNWDGVAIAVNHHEVVIRPHEMDVS